MKIIVNDANILIDLVELKILPYFFKLDVEFRTTTLILDELFQEQQQELLPYIETGKLILEDISETDMEEIIAIQSLKPSLSEQDCSAFFLARKEKAALITSDNTLRKFAKSQRLEVHGHFWILDKLFDSGFFSGVRATEKLNELCNKINPRLGLPEQECQKRISKWNNKNNTS
jgi:predicted nucleic acid-binding protein